MRKLWPGVALIALLAVISEQISSLSWVGAAGISSLIVAILLGTLLGNCWSHSNLWTPGIQFSAKKLLRLAIILYGFRVTFTQIALVGYTAIVLDIVVVSLTLFVGYTIAVKFFKLDRDLSLLISVGAAICGAAAVLAVEDILKSDSHKTAIAIGTVVLFGTISMFLYPALQHAHFFGFTDYQFGLLAGASIHEVAQALVAGSSISNEIGELAVIVKMIRVLLLIPILFLLSAWQNQVISHRVENPTASGGMFVVNKRSQDSHKPRLIIPWFALGFAAVIGFNSLQLLPTSWVPVLNRFDTFLLTMAMGAIGIETKFHKIINVGIRPLYLAFALFIWLLGSTTWMVSWI